MCSEVSAFSTWEKELHKMVFDPRYLLLTSDQRKQVHTTSSSLFITYHSGCNHSEMYACMYAQQDEFTLFWVDCGLFVTASRWWCHCDISVTCVTYRYLISLWRAGWRTSTKRRRVNSRKPEKSSNSCWKRQRSPAGITLSLFNTSLLIIQLCSCKIWLESTSSPGPPGVYLPVRSPRSKLQLTEDVLCSYKVFIPSRLKSHILKKILYPKDASVKVRASGLWCVSSRGSRSVILVLWLKCLS